MLSSVLHISEPVSDFQQMLAIGEAMTLLAFLTIERSCFYVQDMCENVV
jgi:hypothetical protein